MSEKILERCPCCGDASDYDTDEEIDGWFAFCMNRSCGCRSGIFPTKPMARNAWNTRASSPAQEPVTAEPVAWRWKVHGIWHYAGGFPVSGAEPLYAIPAPPQPGREEIARIIEARVLGGAAWEEPQASCYRAADAILALTGEPK